MEYNLKRANPKRSEKRKIMGTEGPFVKPTFRIPKSLDEAIQKEADTLGISKNLYINAILTTRDPRKITQVLKHK